MPRWQIEYTDEFNRIYKWYEKKRPNELIAVTDNLDTYFKTLLLVGNPLQIKAGFIHPEPNGIIAIDQKAGQRKVKVQQTRLYIFPQTEKQILYVLTIGNKRSQREDIKWCQTFVKKVKELP